MSSRDLLKIYAQEANIPELAEIDTSGMKESEYHRLVAQFVTASTVGFTDGDMLCAHPPFEGREARLFGEHVYNFGAVAKGMRQAALDSGYKQGSMWILQDQAADFFLDPNQVFGGFRSHNAVHIFPDTMTVLDMPIPLVRPPETVIDYTSCLSSRSLIDNQIGFLGERKQPFAYIGVTRNHFLNEVIMRSYDNHGPGVRDVMFGKKLYIGREENIVAATNTILAGEQVPGATRIADIILASCINHPQPGNLERGIAVAPALLKENGMLVAIAPADARPAQREIPMEQITAWAQSAGFNTAATQYVYSDRSSHTITDEQFTPAVSRSLVAGVFTR